MASRLFKVSAWRASALPKRCGIGCSTMSMDQSAASITIGMTTRPRPVKLWSAGLIMWPVSDLQFDPHVDHAPIALALANFAVGLDASGHGGLTDRRGAVLVGRRRLRGFAAGWVSPCVYTLKLLRLKAIFFETFKHEHAENRACWLQLYREISASQAHPTCNLSTEF